MHSAAPVTIAMETINLAERYDAPPKEWEAVRASLDAGVTQEPGSGGPDRHTCWLTTINPDGSPHVTGIGALWRDGSFWFETGQRTRKGRNLARDPRCALAVATRGFDLVVEGTAAIVTDPTVVAELARQWAEGGWPAEVDETGVAITASYSAQSAGAPPWHVYRMASLSACALQTEEPYGATRWRF